MQIYLEKQKKNGLYCTSKKFSLSILETYSLCANLEQFVLVQSLEN